MKDETVFVKQLASKLLDVGMRDCNNSFIINRQWFEPFLLEQGVQPHVKGDYVVANAKLIVNKHMDEFNSWVDEFDNAMKTFDTHITNENEDL